MRLNADARGDDETSSSTSFCGVFGGGGGLAAGAGGTAATVATVATRVTDVPLRTARASATAESSQRGALPVRQASPSE